MIEKIIILTLCSIAISSTTWEGMILSKPARWVESKLPEYITKPMFGCYVCCTFWWSILFCAWLEWPVYFCLPALGLSAVISLFSND